MKPNASVWAILVGAALIPLPFAHADADEKAADSDSGSAVVRAERYAAEAFEAYSRSAFAEAVALYQLAYATTPDADIILYNIARTYDLGLHDRRLAIEYYERYAAAPSATPERIALVRQRVAELAAPEATAPVNLDPTTRPEPAPAAPPLSTAHVAAAPLVQPTASTPSADGASSSAWTALELTALTLGGVGVAALGVGVGFGFSANSQATTWQRDCEGNVCASARGVAAAESAADQARIAAVSVITGSTLVALGSVLWWLDSSDPAADGAAILNVVPVAGPSALGGAVSGTF